MAVVGVTSGIDHVVREELSFVERRTEPEVDGIFMKIYTTSEGVERDGIGRDFTVIHTFSTGLAGAFKNVSAQGDNMIDSDNTGQNYMLSPSTTFPTVTDAALPGYVQKKIILVEGLGTFVLPIHIMQADVLPASVANVVALTIQGNAKLVAQSEAVSFYSENSGNGGSQAIFTVTTADSTGTFGVDANLKDPAPGGVADIAVQFDLNDRIAGASIASLMPGMLLDQFDSAGAHKNASGGSIGAIKLIVGPVDYLQGYVTIIGVNAVSGGTEYEHDVDIASGDYFTLAGSGGASAVGFGPAGPDYWLVNSGTIFNINLATHPQFSSQVAAVNGILDEATLNQHVGTFFHAYGSMYMVDSIITTAGVLNQYIENIDGLYRYERNAGALRLKEGWSEFDYTYQGMAFDLLVSRYMPPGTLWGLKLRDQNIKRYVPPSIPGAGRRSEYNQEIQWYGPLAGSKTIFLPARSNDALTQYVEAPYFVFREVCPEQIPGIKLTGLTELFTG